MKIATRCLLPLALFVVVAACKKEAEKAPAPAAPAAPAAAVVYTCTAHPDVALKAPGKCPTCGAELVVKK